MSDQMSRATTFGMVDEFRLVYAPSPATHALARAHATGISFHRVHASLVGARGRARLRLGPSHAAGLVLEPMPSGPAAGMTGQRVMVLPLSVVRNNDPLGWAASITDPREFLVSLECQWRTRSRRTRPDRSG